MSGRVYRFAGYTLDPLARELRRGDAAVALSPRAFDCLVHLIEQRGRAVGKDELVLAIWGRPNVSDTQLGQTVLRARRAVGDDGQVQHVIRTVSRYGYRWIADVDVDEGDADALRPPTPSAAPPPAVPPSATAAGADETPAAAPRRRLPRSRLVLAAGLVLLALALAAYRSAHRPPPAPAPPASASAIVLPLRVGAADGDAWLRLGGMDLVAARLRDGGLAVPPSDSVVALLHDGADDASGAAAARTAAPDALLVRGTLARHGGGWRAELAATAADGTTIAADEAAADALASLRGAADRLLERLGHARPPPAPAAGPLQERLQRAQAAMLANDLDAARSILAGDAELARREPELGYRLAQIDFRAGAYARAEAALGALLAEPAANDPLFRARLLSGRGAVRIRQDDYAGAQQDYAAAVALLRGSAHAPELGLALTGLGVTHAMRHDVEPALAALGAARVQLEAAGDALAVARVDSNLGGLEMTRDRPEQALPYLHAAAAVFERYGAINELVETLASLVSDDLALLRPADALAASDRSWALAARVADPNQRLNLVLDRAEAFLALGRLREAGALLATLPESAPADTPPFAARRLPALRARLALAEGAADAAAAQARRALALRAPADDAGEGVAEIARVYQRAVLMRTPHPAAPPAEPWVPLAADAAYPVQAVLQAEWLDASGDAEGAERLYRRALALAERRGVPADVALAATAYAPWLLRRGRAQEAAEVAGRVSAWAERDFDCALLEAHLFAALDRPEARRRALARAEALAGERAIPPPLREAR